MAFEASLELTDEQIANAPVATNGASHAVPVIDVSAIVAAEELTLETPGVREVVAACKRWGFFQAVGHGVSPDLLDAATAASEGFFTKVPRKEKQAVRRTADNAKGWFDEELTKQKRDWKELYDFGVQRGVMDAPGMDGKNQWPAAGTSNLPTGFEATMKTTFAAFHALAKILVRVMALGIGVRPDYFDSSFEKDTSFVRLNWYPTCPDPSSHWSISHHTDAGAVTVLYQTMVKSLQVFSWNDQTWYEVAPIEHGLVINTGDIMQVWSNDLYIAPLHRVKAQPKLCRSSTVLFLNPSYDTNYEPVNPGGRAHYRPINWGKFRAARSAGDYADVGTENQISHYRTKCSSL